MSKVKRNLQYIKFENPKDYNMLLRAAHLYTENKDSDKEFAKQMVWIVKEILDEYGIEYQDDINEVIT